MRIVTARTVSVCDTKPGDVIRYGSAYYLRTDSTRPGWSHPQSVVVLRNGATTFFCLADDKVEVVDGYFQPTAFPSIGGKS